MAKNAKYDDCVSHRQNRLTHGHYVSHRFLFSSRIPAGPHHRLRLGPTHWTVNLPWREMAMEYDRSANRNDDVQILIVGMGENYRVEKHLVMVKWKKQLTIP